MCMVTHNISFHCNLEQQFRHNINDSQLNLNNCSEHIYINVPDTNMYLETASMSLQIGSHKPNKSDTSIFFIYKFLTSKNCR